MQPCELLIGLSLAISQPVLCRKEKDTWFPGHVSSVSYQSHLPQGPESAVYHVTLDAAPGSESEVCRATPASVALAVSASELKQKYPVGARVVSIYRDDDGGIGYYSGLIAEPPSERNNHRYLLFFDDGYTQYSPPNEIYRICHQSKENWKEATEGSQGFIKRYLAQYPQRPMVRLKPGQSIETELDGEWIHTTVEKVDASLVLIRFSDTHREWIYRGSTRLEPLFNDMNTSSSSTPASRVQGVEVEYGNIERSLTDQSSIADLRGARKSATGNRDPKTVSRSQTQSGLDTRTGTRRQPASVNLAELESAGKVVPYLDSLFAELEHKPFGK
ncbi:unnamed protein product [Echinostoma caproni]|uniref:Tudor domain-containing protein n=1 Tax=Echinostoma caproni TaxID=27848 RepID=A0A3P8FA55_9TREM|nr:unnamed protein product [Echinostoma caproni]